MATFNETRDKFEREKRRQLKKEYNAGSWLAQATSYLDRCLDSLEQAQTFLQNDEEIIVDEQMGTIKKVRNLLASRFNAHISTYNRNGQNSNLAVDIETEVE